jgi:SAM-dependent methyltransferase
METTERKSHWENIYNTKALTEVSWHQPTPQTSLDLIAKANHPKNASIIDIGGGDSFLVDHLLEAGYTDVTVLDISAKAIERAKERLGSKANLVKWIVSDITSFAPETTYDIWHDRAAFHFLNSLDDVVKYKDIIEKGTNEHSTVIIGAFSENGPLKCSGIEITQYSEDGFESTFEGVMELSEVVNVDHKTPFDTIQNFNFGVFKPLK